MMRLCHGLCFLCDRLSALDDPRHAGWGGSRLHASSIADNIVGQTYGFDGGAWLAERQFTVLGVAMENFGELLRK